MFITLTKLISFKAIQPLDLIRVWRGSPFRAGLKLVLALLLLGTSAASLAVTVSAGPSTCVSLGGANQNWTNTNLAQAQDNSYATATVNDGQVTDPLQCTGYGFAIPAGAVINGITATVWRYASNGSCCTDAQMQLVKAGTIQATDRSTTTYYPTSNTAEAHGSATDLWGTTWTAADINNTNFGAVFAAQKPVTAGGNRTVSVDYLQITVDYTLPTILSINTASTNPTAGATAVAWTVIFSTSVTGVTASNFALVQTGGVSGATIASVTGSGTTWTVYANTGSGTGTLGLNMVNVTGISPGITTTMPFAGQTYNVTASFCSPPSDIPSGVSVTCQCDTFNRTTLSPSTIFGANWIVNSSGTTAYTPNITNQGYLRLTDTNGNEATSATVPGIFPAAGNYISVEFQQYAYNGSGADGLAVTLSDYAQTAIPGAFGGSLGYAQKTGINGFNGGWVGIALDEYGNYENNTEGRSGGISGALYPQSVGVRGSGSGTIGYPWLAGATGLSPGIANSGSATRAYGYYYQIIVDARNAANTTPQTYVSVNRDTSGGGTAYSPLVTPFDVFATNPSQAAVPTNWQISFTGSTGGATDIHEIGSLRICAQSISPPSGGTAVGFNAIDSAYGTPPAVSALNYVNGHIYTKLQGTAFNLDVAAMNSNNQILTTYAQTSAKTVTVNLVDNSNGVCILDSTKANYCNAACIAKPAVAGGNQSLVFASGATDKGQKQSAAFTLNSAYQNLVAIISDGTTRACSTDAFSVRPLGIASVTSGNATNTGTSGTPIFKAGSSQFALTATSTGVTNYPSNYTGVLKINNATLLPVSPATVAGSISGTFSAATPGTPSSIATATGSTFTYSDVGGFTLPVNSVYDGVVSAVDCASMTTAQCDTLRAATWTGVDSISTKGDCVTDSYVNTPNAAGKYGCNFGLLASTATIGRFVPDHFAVTSTMIVNRADLAVTGSIAAGSGILTLSSAAGVKVGDTISIAGAGAAGAAFFSTVQAVSANGTTVTLATTAVTAVTSVPVNVSAFTYMGEPMNAIFTLTAQSASNTTTKNYTGTLAKLNPLAAVAAGTGGPLGLGMVNSAATRTPFTACTATPVNPCFTPATATTGAFINGVASSITVPLMVYRGTSPAGPYAALNIGIAPVDSDGVATSYDLNTTNVASIPFDHTKIADTAVYYGRINISSAYGSELLQLPVPVALQYWNGSYFAPNTFDNLTTLNVAPVNSGNWTNLTPTGWKKLSATSTWAAGATSASPSTASVVFANGAGSFTLIAPGQGNTGSVSISVPPVITGCFAAAAPLGCYLPSNIALATFGIYKGAKTFMYLRENY